MTVHKFTKCLCRCFLDGTHGSCKSHTHPKPAGVAHVNPPPQGLFCHERLMTLLFWGLTIASGESKVQEAPESSRRGRALTSCLIPYSPGRTDRCHPPAFLPKAKVPHACPGSGHSLGLSPATPSSPLAQLSLTATSARKPLWPSIRAGPSSGSTIQGFPLTCLS